MMRRALALFLAVSIGLGPSIVLAATYHVDVDSLGGPCSDSNAGTSEAAPWCTVQRATGQVVPGGAPNGTRAPGDIVKFKAGTYTYAVSPGSAQSPCINSTASGTSGNPITFQRYDSSHDVVVDCNTYSSPDANGSPTFGASGRSYITWDGIRPANGTQRLIVVHTSSNIIIKNAVWTKGTRPGSAGTGNYYCFYLENSQNVTITNNQCTDSYTASDPDDANAGGVVTFNNQNLTVSQNSFINVGTCLDDKNAGRNNLWTCNYCVANPDGRGMQFTSLGGSCGSSCQVQNNEVSYNVFRGDGSSVGSANLGININLGSSADHHDFTLKNNTFYRHRNMLRTTGTTAGVHFWNNIGWLETGTDPYAQRHNPPAGDLVTEYNTYRQNSGTLSFGTADTGSLQSLATWQAAGRDNDLPSGTSDPLFASASSTDNASTDFRISATLNGNTAYDGTGTTVSQGAFGGSCTPGYAAEAAPGDPPVTPAPPPPRPSFYYRGGR